MRRFAFLAPLALAFSLLMGCDPAVPPTIDGGPDASSHVVFEPRKVLAEFGTIVPDDVAVRVHDSLADLRYLVLPKRPAGSEGWTSVQLKAIITRDCMVGVANPTTRA